MIIDDIKIGDTYQLTFTPKVGKVKITQTLASNKTSVMTTSFYRKYGDTPWEDYQDKHVIVLRKSIHFPPGICFHFKEDVEDLNCTIYPDYFKPTDSTSTNPKSFCHCNIWISGCTCGAFKSEQQGIK